MKWHMRTVEMLRSGHYRTDERYYRTEAGAVKAAADGQRYDRALRPGGSDGGMVWLEEW